MKALPALLLALPCLALAAPPAFENTSAPEGWTVVKGQAEPGNVLQAKGGALLDLQAAAPLPVPCEAVFRVRCAEGDGFFARALAEDKDAKPLLEVGFKMIAGPTLNVVARASGEAMATEAESSRTWSRRDKRLGALQYRWRFPKVRNLWDDRDSREIGAACAGLVPFEEKVFTLRMVLAKGTRQAWVDDRLVAEERADPGASARWSLQLTKGAKVLSAEFPPVEDRGRFLPLPLERWSHARAAQAAKAAARVEVAEGVPVRLPAGAETDLDLGASLDRYRLSHGSGPDTSYVDAGSSWTGSFRVDPARLAFRVPYRNYQAAWLLAWVDDRPNAVAKGTLRFFRENAGYPASTDFEVSDEAARKGLVKKLPLKSAGGKALCLVKVPLDTVGLYGLRDMADQFLEFELAKPVALLRSYPDPIYYGWHPAGPPSSVHVVGITLEEAPFGFAVEPKQTMFVYEAPEKPAVTVRVDNTTAKAIEAEVRASTASHDGAEARTEKKKVSLEPGKSAGVGLAFDLKKLGWHSLKVEVEAAGCARAAELSLVTLPPNPRTYGYAQNETRFGVWELSGHYTAMKAGDLAGNERLLALYRRLGLRCVSPHSGFLNLDLLKKHGFLPKGSHSIGRNFRSVNLGQPPPPGEMEKAVAAELENVVTGFPSTTYFYGGEWGLSEAIQYAAWPLYTGDGDRDLTADERAKADRHVMIFTAIGKAIREKRPGTKLILQWGAPLGTLAYMRAGMPKDLVDMYGMDAPMFELLPELSNVTGSINSLWVLRQEAKRLGWPKLSMAWCEGPFFPTNPGALTAQEQAEYQIRYTLLALAYGVEQFEAGIVPQDAGNYYGAEHYGAGLFQRIPLDAPKPAAAAFATLSAMVCGADVVGPVDTGSPTAYCLAFRRAKDQAMVYALWRAQGASDATVAVRGAKPVLTDSMGNAAPCAVKDGAITVPLSTMPVWLTGAGEVGKISLSAPRYAEAPAKVTRPLAPFTAGNWAWDGSEDKAYAHNHFAIRRVTDPNLKAEFGPGEAGHPEAVTVTLPVEPGDRPMASRYGQLKLKSPVTIPGKASALGVWIKGNASWGRVAYQCRDAKGETWVSTGTKDDWNCDDTHGWSYVGFEGWRYVRFPLPGSQPWDSARELETTWWGSRGGDGIVDLPLTLEKVFVEARNEVPVLGEMKVVPVRGYLLSGLVAEYAREEDATDKAVAASRLRMPLPEWSGPTENPIARLAAEGAGAAPAIKGFAEPSHFNDGRTMHVRFDQDPALVYNLYLSRLPDGRGADLLVKGVKDNQLIGGLRPELKMYLFLTSVGPDKKESKPSAAFELVTHDNFAEK
jgi:hypothetical protein